jgi:hypothetical protein
MINLGHRMFNAPPHPNPLPKGEGTGSARLSTFKGIAVNSSRRFSRETANVSLSPGGGGQGEGVRSH